MSEDARRRALRGIAAACVLLMMLVVSSSAWLRLSQPRAACSDWPGCRLDAPRSVPPATAGAPPPLLERFVRAVHRTAASLALLASGALVALALLRRPRLREPGALALALLALALALAGLGIVTPGSRSTAVLLGNLLGGLAMFALAWRLQRRLRRPPAAAPAAGAATGPVVAATSALWLLQAALGGLSGAGQWTVAPLLHLLLALAVLPLAVRVGWQARASGRAREGSLLLALVALQALFGGLAAATAAAPALTLLHNLGGAVGLALLVGLAPAPGPAPAPAGARA